MQRGFFLVLLIMVVSVTLAAFEPNFTIRPAISPDGANVCFVYQGDLWVVSFKGGTAKRLTSTTATEHRPLWSPDGKSIAFNSNREGQYYIYIMPATGGPAQPLLREGTGLLIGMRMARHCLPPGGIINMANHFIVFLWMARDHN